MGLADSTPRVDFTSSGTRENFGKIEVFLELRAHPDVGLGIVDNNGGVLLEAQVKTELDEGQACGDRNTQQRYQIADGLMKNDAESKA
jgi:hypothetical protein